MKTIIINIKQLLQVRAINVIKVSGLEMSILPKLENAFLIIDKNFIEAFGNMIDCPNLSQYIVINADQKTVLPTWCDSHTHIVYAGNRELEFVDRLQGLSYEAIANKGGGILNSAQKLNQTSEQELYKQSEIRLKEVIAQGTGAVEIKSGYGLTVEGELKMLSVIKKLAHNYKIAIKATFLGAHAFPAIYKQNQECYIDLIINEMLPAIAQENLADFVDVFCETGYFTVLQTQKIIKAAKSYGLIPKIHVNQFTNISGIEMAVQNNALSVDHLEIVSDQDIAVLKNSVTIAVALPLCSFFIEIPYTPARKIIDAGLPIAIATDFNPGTAPSGNMNLVVAMACIKMKMTTEEAINAATINGAYAMNLSQSHGSITVGKRANLIITKPLTSYHQIPYNFGSNLIETVIIEGIVQ